MVFNHINFLLTKKPQKFFVIFKILEYQTQFNNPFSITVFQEMLSFSALVFYFIKISCQRKLLFYASILAGRLRVS